MSDFPDFAIRADSPDVQESVLADLGEWWNALGQEQVNDYLSSWDDLCYGDTTIIDGYVARCVKEHTSEEPFVGFLITIH